VTKQPVSGLESQIVRWWGMEKCRRETRRSTLELEKNKEIEDEKARDEHQSSAQKVWGFSYGLDTHKPTD